MYGVGSIFVSYTTSLYTPIRTFSYIPPIICIVIGLVNFVNPGGVFNKIARLVDVKFNWVLKELNTEEESRDGEGDGDGGQRRLAETGENRELMKIKIEKNVIEEQS